jgi:hypothetical protein
MNKVRVVLAAAAMVFAAPAHADPSPPPTPYQIPGPSGPVLGGVQTYQPTCLEFPMACAMHYDPSRGVWVPTGDQ